MLFLFYGSGWKPSTYYSRLRFAVLDLDGGADLVGGAVLSAAQTLPYSILPQPSSGSLASLSAAVDAGTFHVGIYVPAGASAALLAAVLSNGASYDPTAQLSFIFDEGRGGSAMAPLLRAAAAQIGAVASAKCAGALLAMNAGAAVGTLNTAVLVQPVSARLVNLHPVPIAGEATVAGIAVITIWITVLAATTIVLGVYDGWEAAGIRRDQQIAFRLLHLVLTVGFIALWPPVVTVGLGAHLSVHTFFAMWAFCWLFMTCFASIITALFRTLGAPLGNAVHGLFLILNLVSSSGVTPQELMPAFFRIGYGLPFYNAVAGLRTILFGSWDNLGRNIGVLFAWIGLCWSLALWKAARHRRALLEGRVLCTKVSVVGH